MNTLNDIHTEQKLVELLKNKDKQAFSTLYDNYSPALYGIILKVIESRESAEDVLQEVFVKIWNNIETYDAGKGRLYTWMLNIARNTAIDKLRSKDFKNEGQNRTIDKYVHSVKADDLISKTDTIGLKKIIQQLKPDQYVVIDMMYFKGYSQSEIAKALDLPLGTVKTRARAALMELRTLLK